MSSSGARTSEGSVTPDDVERAAELIAGQVRETPLLPAGELSRRVGAPVVLKAECLQLTGSFKVRGAFHKMGRLSPDELARGVVTASAGNHAQAVALAASRLGTHADLFMPIEAPLAKVAAVRGYGGEVHLVDGSYEEASEEAVGFAEHERKTVVPPFDDAAVVAGAGTVGLEIARKAPAARLIVVPLGGGGLASGVAIAVKSQVPHAKVIGVQAEACAPYVESPAADRAIGARSASTICDGIAVKQPGELTLPLVERHLDGVVTVSDDEVAEAMVLLLERSKLVVEGAGAVGVAALLAGKVEPAAEDETCAVLSGGNVDASRLAECIRLGETAAGRRMVLWTVVPDRPGALAALLRLVAEHGANVMDVEHIREGVDLHVRETAIELVLQTDGPEHSTRIVEAIRAEGFSTRLER
ncbi:MAG: threonine ammonia-lyase [Actinobacteria bacterium 13_1_20CM_3_68_9]|nr:MAG: threonine ammonia-lyase [Actinobacteria bacterium 13_1_20CM_3_68_9]